MKPGIKLVKRVKMTSCSAKLSLHCGVPIGFLPVYVGEERERFIIPTSFLLHPLFSMLLEKAYEEYGYEHRNGLSFPCTVCMFQEVVSVVKCSHGQFHLEKLFEFIVGGEY